MLSWIAYLLFIFLAFPVFSISVMLFSIALSMVGAWCYGISGCLVTTALSVTSHYALLDYYSDDKQMLMEAVNPFGISTQLLVSGAVALLQRTRRRLDQLNRVLEQRVEERTAELQKLQHHIVKNQETAQVLLSHMLLGDIGESLTSMLADSRTLLNHLEEENNPYIPQAIKLKRMISDSLEIVQNLEFVDHFFANQNAGFEVAVHEMATHFRELLGTEFEVVLHERHREIPKHIQHQLYRITQEAITNAVRHAKAARIGITLEQDAHYYRLSVVNNGHPMPHDIECGLGMRLMLHRTEQLGGKLEWVRSADCSTCLRCIIPCSSN